MARYPAGTLASVKIPSMNILWWSLLLALAPFPAVAHNGALALAVPVEGIKVDGIAHGKVRLQSLSAEGLWMQIAKDQQGGFAE